MIKPIFFLLSLCTLVTSTTNDTDSFGYILSSQAEYEIECYGGYKECESPLKEPPERGKQQNSSLKSLK